MKFKKIFVSAATVCATSTMFYGATTPLQQAIAAELQKPNFITIVIDDMGYSDLGVFGGEAQTPNLDQLAKDGIILTNFYAASSSSPSRAMLFSGKDNHDAGLGDMRENMGREPRPEQIGQPGYEGILSLEIPTFPQLLQDGGYHTMMTGKWHMGGDEEGEEAYYGINRGFSETRGLLLAGGDLDYMISAEGKYLTEHPVEHMHGRASLYNTNGEETDFSTLPPLTHSTDYFTDNAIAMLENRDTNKPFYLNVSYLAPHMPLQAPKELIDKYVDTYAAGWDNIRAQRLANLKKMGYVPEDVTLSEMPGDVKAWETLTAREKQLEARRMAVYTAELDLLDQNVGRLVEYLKQQGIYENTVIYVYSDNGPANSGFAAPPEGVTNHNMMIPHVNELSEAEFQQMMNDLGGPTSWLSPNSGWGSVTNVPFSYYKADTFDGGTRGAAFVSYPQASGSGVKTNCLYSVMDLAPTLLDMADVEYPTEYNGHANSPMDGISMANIFEGSLVCNPDRWIGFELHGIKGLRKGNWKLSQANGIGNIVGLFNVWNDPFEQTELSAAMPGLYQEMWGLYNQYAQENGVIEINNLYLPDLTDPATTSATIRGGSTSVQMSGRTFGFRTEATFQPMDAISVAAEVRPATEHLGLPGKIFVRIIYTLAGDSEPLYLWRTPSGFSDVEMPFREGPLPNMTLVPVFDGNLPDPAYIEVAMSYQLADGTLVDPGNPIKITIAE